MKNIFFCIISILMSSFVLSYCMENCLRERKKLNVQKLIILFILLFSVDVIYILEMLKHSNKIIIIHLFMLFIIGTIYKKKMKRSIVLFTLLYYIHVIYSLGFCSLVAVELSIYTQIQVFLINIFILVLYTIILVKFKENYLNVSKDTKIVPMIIISSVMEDLIALLSFNLYNKKIENITIIYFIVFMVLVISYLYKIYIDSTKINELNIKLEEKNIELKNIKNNHANMIFYLENLYKNGEIDEGGIVLKKIINNEDDTIEIIKNKNLETNSMIKTALLSAMQKGINVKIDEECDVFIANINEIELYRCIVNIINNAVKAMSTMDTKGEIRVNTYYTDKENIEIVIGNNGPKIPESQIEKIFKAGFTTKENSEKNHGYGLCIVKEIIEGCKGKIIVDSNEKWTEFKLILPIRKIKC